MTKTYYIYKAFKNNKWYRYSEKYETKDQAYKWLTHYRKIVGFTLQKELTLFTLIEENEN